MTTPESPSETDADADAALHRRFGSACNNRGWALADRPERTADEDRELLDTAHAAAWHWSRVGTELQRRRAAMLVCQAHAALRLGGAPALEAATVLRDWFLARDDTPDWERAFAHLVHANAAAAADDAPAHGDSWQRSEAAIAAIADDEDRAIVLVAFASVPKPA